MNDRLNAFYRALFFMTAAALVPILFSACGAKENAGAKDMDVSAKDMEAITQLHQRDMQASKTWDVETLVSLWTDDIVALPEGGKPIIGKEANRASLLKLREQSQGLEITDYKLTFNEVKILGDWAFEWGKFEGVVKPAAGGEPESSSGKVMRILRRQPDGSWKVARTMYNSDATEPLEDEPARQ